MLRFYLDPVTGLPHIITTALTRKKLKK